MVGSILASDTRLEQKWLALANGLAYYDKAKIKSLKKFYNTGPRVEFSTLEVAVCMPYIYSTVK